MKVVSLTPKTTPLCYMPDGRLVCYQSGDIVVFECGKELCRFHIINEKKEKLFGRFNILTRFMRLGIRAAIAIDELNIALSIGNKICELNTNSGELSKGYICEEGVRPLTFTILRSVDGFEEGIYFGGYVHNFDKSPVSIYRRKGTDDWEIVFTFPQGTINHVHNMISDSFRNCVWIFTGDFGDSAAIWKASDGFKRIERVVSGDQKWRGCVAYSIPEGLLYATDTPFVKNHIYLLKENKDIAILGDLTGSCIYGSQWKDKYVFSTVVEPDGRNETLLRLLFGWRRGAGIEDDYARVYCGTIKEGFTEIYKEKKDNWPYIFQFGAFRFPSGLNTGDTLYFQPVATKKNDLKLLAIKN